MKTILPFAALLVLFVLGTIFTPFSSDNRQPEDTQALPVFAIMAVPLGILLAGILVAVLLTVSTPDKKRTSIKPRHGVAYIKSIDRSGQRSIEPVADIEGEVMPDGPAPLSDEEFDALWEKVTAGGGVVFMNGKHAGKGRL